MSGISGIIGFVLGSSISSGDNSFETRDKSEQIMENTDESNNHISSLSNQCINCPKPTDTRIMHNHPFYYCIEHPKFENIHLEVIESHLILAKDHKSIMY
ncbi:MAG TPA: hypothetical protein VIY08_03220 [Candidatus Nitrosocosmicus sp.]